LPTWIRRAESLSRMPFRGSVLSVVYFVQALTKVVCSRSAPPSLENGSLGIISGRGFLFWPRLSWRPLGLRSPHCALRFGATLRAHVGDVIQFPGDWHGAVWLHRLSAAGTQDNGQGCRRFAIHSATRIKGAMSE
jgi:hypothetical protein